MIEKESSTFQTDKPLCADQRASLGQRESGQLERGRRAHVVQDVAVVVTPWIMLRFVFIPLSVQIHESILMGEWAESNVFIQKLSPWILNRDCLEALINMNYQMLIYRYIYIHIYFKLYRYIYQCLVGNGFPNHYMLLFKLYISNSTSLARRIRFYFLIDIPTYLKL